MKILLDVKDAKASFIMELLASFSYVKAKPLSPQKARLLSEIKEAVHNLNLVEAGKQEARPLSELLDEL